MEIMRINLFGIFLIVPNTLQTYNAIQYNFMISTVVYSRMTISGLESST